ncbi:MAG TPA: DNA gyrase inhibitor YacG [Vitreimonas sp.]|nr:DNA gyrase inhibitor YacG [Vitreimonas sp.]
MSERKCVICGKPQDEKYRPFCSKRCADVDLNRWFSGRYAIPAEEEREPSAEDASDKNEQ